MKKMTISLSTIFNLAFSPNYQSTPGSDAPHMNGHWVNVISRFTLTFSLVNVPLFYFLTQDKSIIYVGATSILFLCLVFYFNRVGKFEVAKVLFFIVLNALSLCVSSLARNTGAIQLLDFFLLALVFFLFDRIYDRVLCLVMIAVRTLFAQAGLAYIEPFSIESDETRHLAIRGICYGETFFLIILMFYLYAIQQVRLRKVSQQKNRFFQHMSHDVQSAYSSVEAICDLLKDAFDNQIRLENEEEVVGQLLNASHFCGYMLNDFVRYSKAEATREGEEVAETVDLVEQAQLVIELFEPRASVNGSKILLDIEEHASTTAKVDRIKINRILMNLLTNAIKNTVPNGLIRVKVTLDDRKYQLSVFNEGYSIRLEDIQKLFLSYEEKLNLGNPKRVGLGLGIVKELVESLNGSIEVSSDSHQPTCFTVIIPLV